MFGHVGQLLFETQNIIQCYFKKNAPMFNLNGVKDKISRAVHFNLVYKFKCNIFSDTYYGKIIIYFEVRTCEHLGITLLILFRMGLFGTTHGWGEGRQKGSLTRPLSSTDINIFPQKSANFGVSRNTDIDSILIRKF